jgi:hypothetical protein
MFNEGNQIHNFMSSSGSGTVINYGFGSDFLTSYGYGSGSTSQKVTVPTVPVPVPQHCCFQHYIRLEKNEISLIISNCLSFDFPLNIRSCEVATLRSFKRYRKFFKTEHKPTK